MPDEGFTIINRSCATPLLLTCEHAATYIPDRYAGLGLRAEDVVDHIGWDIGAAILADELSRQLAAPAVLSGVSRLLVDCNRDLTDHDLMPAVSHGVVIPGNSAISVAERQKRLDAHYHPYHQAIDGILESRPVKLLLSIHSFTPALNGSHRPFDVGVLFDDCIREAEYLAAAIVAQGFTARMNEPYSGLDGLIFSARSHGRGHGVTYLELEVNNGLLRDEAPARAIGRRLAAAVSALPVLA